MKLEEGLKNIGLKGSEIKVYLYLLENGVSTPPQIAKGTRIARTNTYHILRGLSEKGLIERQEKALFTHLPTRPPFFALLSAEKKQLNSYSLIFKRFIKLRPTNR